MTFASYETSVEQGTKVSLYLIEYGENPDAYFGYSDGDQVVVFDGRTFNPIVIGREKVESSGSLDQKAMEVQIDPAASVVAFYNDTPPSGAVRLTIY